MESVMVGKGRGKIFGSVPIPSGNMNSFDGTYATLVTSQSNRYSNMDNYLLDYGCNYTTATGNAPPTTAQMPTGDIYLTLDDPYPGTWYNNFGVVATVQYTCTYDVTTYSTWSMRGHVN